MPNYDDKRYYTSYGSLRSKRDNTEINSHGTDVRMVVGRRSNGKTYPTLTFDGVKHFIDSGCKEAFAYVRRFDSDFRVGKLATLLFANGCVANGWLNWYTKGEWNDIYYYQYAWYLRQIDEEGKVVKKCKQPVCYAFAINQCEKYKGADHPDIVMVILDEFIPMKGARGYCIGEWQLWQNLLSSIVRERGDVVVYLLANTISKNCPYFDHYGIDIDKIEQGTISIFKYKSGLTLAVEYCKDEGDVHIESSKYFDLTDEENMITDGVWETSQYPRLPKKYRKYRDFMCYYPIFFRQGNKWIECDMIATEQMNMLYFHMKTGPIKYDDDIIYAERFDSEELYKHTYRIGLNPHVYELDAVLLKMLTNNQCYFQDNDTGEKVKYFFENAKEGSIF